MAGVIAIFLYFRGSPGGTLAARPASVAGIKRFEDLVAYQRSVELRDVVYDITHGGRVSADRRFRDQLRDSACSAPSNIAEGFSRYSPREFARFVAIARGSLAETQNHLKHGLRQGYFAPPDYDRAWAVSCRAMSAVGGLGRYLRSCKGSKAR
ncbi:MAG: four helix bundle protein [Vicinamibacterales bacterium]